MLTPLAEDIPAALEEIKEAAKKNPGLSSGVSESMATELHAILLLLILKELRLIRSEGVPIRLCWMPAGAAP